MNSETRQLAWLAALFIVAGCQAKAALPTGTQPSVAPSAQPAAAAPKPAAEASEPPPVTAPLAEPAPPPAAASLNVESYTELMDVLLKRDIFKVGKDGALAQFGKFVSLNWKQPDILIGKGPREELELAFYGCTGGDGDCIGTVGLTLFADNESEAIAAHRALEKRLKSKLGKIKGRSNTDTSTPSFQWMNGRDIWVLLSARPSHRGKEGQWQVDINFQPPEEP